MKIDGKGPDVTLEPLTSNRTDAVRRYAGGSAPAGGVTAGGEDTVQLSGDAQLASRVREIAGSGQPAIRWDRVEQARQQLAAGQVGADPLALADRLITHLLDE